MQRKLLMLLIIEMVTFKGHAQTLPALALSSPSNGAINQPVSVTLLWQMPPDYYIADIEWDTTKNFSATSPQAITYGGHGFTLNLSYSTTYYWTAATTDGYGNVSAWAGTWSFTTAAPSPTLSGRPLVVPPSFSIKNGIASYFLDKPDPVDLRIYDIRGRELYEFRRFQITGNHSLVLKNLNLAVKSYIVRFKAGSLHKEITVVGN